MNDKISILLAEDEMVLGQIIKESLETRDFIVTHVEDGEKAFKNYQKEAPDLLVLDVMMPNRDGFTLAKEIRKTDKTTPIIFLTSKSQTQDVIDGFQHGGNDYLKKPFSMEELIVRIHALLNRVQLQKDLQHIVIGNYIFNYQKQSLNFQNIKINLTHRETQLLYHLQQHKNEILDRSFILKKLWGDDDFFNARSMDVFITKLRKKLNKDDSIQIINVRGYGYKLID
ncbi:response regulator transcription factor [Sinomicrobium weinanense]|uniref:Response regulator transcription factor n=1 Tax=Sinomicrobium weinanense TaxID=2842200 RepID=A0A926JRY1_9FLAO|nr:response regulator transcription factor [Sinomicrobium weinanense]MBC9796131.1 response regulator transcription factor [Sinomicrobium weinanense]MBU3121882.1 response regulator transcription factor [Sinomicrobium weinanense]